MPARDAILLAAIVIAIVLILKLQDAIADQPTGSAPIHAGVPALLATQG